MATITMSSRGRITLPAALRRRLGIGAGAKLELLEEANGLTLRVVRSLQATDVSVMAGLVQAPKRGVARRLEAFDPASMRARSQRFRR